MSRRVEVGYVPLLDAAPLVIAAEMGFAAEEGLDLVLNRELSWAALRDRLIWGRYAAAHMLAPVVIAQTAGIGAGDAARHGRIEKARALAAQASMKAQRFAMLGRTHVDPQGARGEKRQCRLQHVAHHGPRFEHRDDDLRATDRRLDAGGRGGAREAQRVGLGHDRLDGIECLT